MKPHRRIVVLVLSSLPVFLAGFSCESSRETRPDAAVAVEKAAAVDTNALVERVENIRDREFEGTPRFRAVDQLEASKVRGSDAYVADRAILEEVLFGRTSDGVLPRIRETQIARFDPKGNVIRYEKGADRATLERALFFAVVDALNREAFATPKRAESWDEALAQTAALRSDGAFAWAAGLAAEKDVSRQVLAHRPEIVVQLEPARNRFVEPPAKGGLDALEDSFILREGFALAAALYRSGGWSSAELARISGPESTEYVVRPDRWLGEGGVGSWTFESAHDERLDKKGWILDREGMVGPGITSIWLAEKIDLERSRSVYASWQSDAYRVFRKDGDWWFEWLSLWKTPSDATQISGALNKGLSSIEGAAFEVVDSGPTVSVVGSSKRSIDEDELLARASANAQILPVFEPRERGMVEFVPTTLDAYLAAVADAELDEESKTWVDPATKMRLDVEALREWQVQKTDDASARWVARKDGTSMLMTTQLVDPLQPSFDTEAFEIQVARNFERSVSSAKTRVERVSLPVANSMKVQVTGDFEGSPTRIQARIVNVGDVVVTFSLKGAPGAVQKHLNTFEELADSMQIETRAKGEEPGEGIIEFKVE